MGWAHVQDTPGSGNSSGGGSVSTINLPAFGSPNQIGNFIVVWAWGFRSGQTSGNVTVTDNAQTPNTYTQLFFKMSPSVGWCCVFLARIALLPSSGNLAVSVSVGPAQQAEACAAEFSGGTLKLDGSAVLSNGTSSTTPTSGSYSTAVSNDLIIGVLADDASTNGLTVTTPSGFTAAGTFVNGGTSEVGQGCYQIASGTVSSTTAQWSVSGGGNTYATGIVALQPAPPISADPVFIFGG